MKFASPMILAVIVVTILRLKGVLLEELVVDKEGNGDFTNIQKCVDEAQPGDICLISPGNYHEEIVIQDKKDLTIKSKTNSDRAKIDGTIILQPKNGWKEETIDGKTVCIGKVKVADEKHPFQLFYKENDTYDMMTNARWPNALWTDLQNHQTKSQDRWKGVVWTDPEDPNTGVPKVFYNDYWAKHATENKTQTPGKMTDKKTNGTSPLAASGLNMEGAMAILNIGSFNTWHRKITGHKKNQDFFLYDDHHINNEGHTGTGIAQYYIDSKKELLDNPGEWFYKTKSTKRGKLRFMPPTNGSCPESTSDKVRARVIDYSIRVISATNLKISDLDFFASNIIADGNKKNKNVIKGLYLDSLNFNYPVSSHRMLGDDSVPKTTKLISLYKGGPIHVKNCSFFGGEGNALVYASTHKDVKIENNVFKWNDWSGINAEAPGTVVSIGGDGGELVKGNTWVYNGASVAMRPGKRSIVTENLFVGQRRGNIMNDGSNVQLPVREIV